MIYFSYFHSIMSYGIIFWGNPSQNNFIFNIQKGTIRVTVNSSSRTSCHELFTELQDFHSSFSVYLFLINVCFYKNAVLNQILMFIITAHYIILICTCLHLIQQFALAYT
jgi:hypothetical protein